MLEVKAVDKACYARQYSYSRIKKGTFDSPGLPPCGFLLSASGIPHCGTQPPNPVPTPSVGKYNKSYISSTARAIYVPPYLTVRAQIILPRITKQIYRLEYKICIQENVKHHTARKKLHKHPSMTIQESCGMHFLPPSNGYIHGDVQ